MTLTVDNLTAAVQGRYTNPMGIGLGAYNFTVGQQQPLTDGVGANQADQLYQSAVGGRTILASGSEDLDLSGLFPDALGNTLALVKVKAVWIWANVANTHDLIVGGGTNPFLGWNAGGTETIPPDGLLMRTNRVNGWPVTAGTGDILKIANAGAVTPVTYEILIVGCSA